jgi:hypothetical protein
MEIKYRTMLDIVKQNREKKDDMVTELEMLTNKSRNLDKEIGELANELSVRKGGNVCIWGFLDKQFF